MTGRVPVMGDLSPVRGVRIGTANAGIKQTERDDMTLMLLGPHATVAGVFTQSAFRAPPVEIAEQRLAGAPRALIINSGNANAATGEAGAQDARRVCDAVAQEVLEVDADAVLPFSTGVIGERLPVDAMRAAMTIAAQKLDESHWSQAARAIMTTDTVPKGLSRQLELAGETLTITGIAKGSGMIKPNMATMLAFIATDAAVAAEVLQPMLRRVADLSFNRVTVDGDTSTNDSFMLVASGEGRKLQSDEELSAFEAALLDVAQTLARWIAGDGEGASKLVTVEVGGGRTTEDCLAVAYTIAESPLVKTAIFAGDPNWGRFCMAIGRADAEVDPDRVTLHLGDVCIAERGMVAPGYLEADAARVMSGDELTVRVDLGLGEAQAWVWTCDLSYDYVKINAEYRT